MFPWIRLIRVVLNELHPIPIPRTVQVSLSRSEARWKSSSGHSRYWSVPSG